jgi:hypothetical protein
MMFSYYNITSSKYDFSYISRPWHLDVVVTSITLISNYPKQLPFYFYVYFEGSISPNFICSHENISFVQNEKKMRKYERKLFK